MANLDSRKRRASSVQVLVPFVMALVLADGQIGQADRQHIAWTYSGISAGAGAGIAKGFICGERTLSWALEDRSQALTCGARTTTFTVEAR